MIDLAAAIDAAVKSEPAPRWPTFDGKFLDRRDFVTASEIGKCARQVKFSKQNPRGNPEKFTPDAKWGFFERGNYVERFIVERLRAGLRGAVDTHFLGDDQKSFYDRWQSGTPDGLLRAAEGDYVLEFKSIDPRTSQKALPKHGHPDQVYQNMDLMQVCLGDPESASNNGLSSPVNIVGGILFYVNASNYQVTTQFNFSPNVGEFVRLEERAEQIMTAATPYDLPAEGTFTGECRHCDFKMLCQRTQEKIENTQEKINGDAGIREAGRAFFT